MQVKKELWEWFGNARGDILAGLVSSFAVIPEVVGFCIVAGISPMMGLYASLLVDGADGLFGRPSCYDFSGSRVYGPGHCQSGAGLRRPIFDGGHYFMWVDYAAFWVYARWAI